VAALAVESAIGLRTLPTLSGTMPVSPDMARPVSIIVAARNEERHVDGAVGTLLAQDYPDLEVIVIDDRSTDGTGAILDDLAERWRRESERAAREGHSRARLRVIHLDALPAGWLGKNHALHRGAEAAGGDLLLFSDADVMMRRDALARAVGLLERRGLDHLAVAPRMHGGGPWATMTMAVFVMLFSALFKPWKARDPRSRYAIGVGAFNLVRAEAYRAIGGHAGIALRPDDDLRLGRRLKEAGFRQAAAIGRNTVMVEWYPSLRAMARGLRKNAFAAVDYRIAPVLAGTVLPFLFVFWPIAALFLAEGMVLRLNVAILLVALVSVWDAARIHGLPRWVALTYPLASVLLLWIIWAATLRTIRTGGIEWRETRYALEELRRG
jgi:cellulose synthase/poly-beta-1,6-N-acetylglucosamine synthase-like glycosyltransferase